MSICNYRAKGVYLQTAILKSCLLCFVELCGILCHTLPTYVRCVLLPLLPIPSIQPGSIPHVYMYYMFSGFVCVLQVVLVLRSTRHSMCSETSLEEKTHLPPCLVGLSSVTLDHSEVGCDDLVLYACALCVCVFG